jgi:hypothetical protein
MRTSFVDRIGLCVLGVRGQRATSLRVPLRSPRLGWEDKYLLDMVLAGQKIRRFLSGYDKQRFVADEKTISAVER